mmetsp:Transcript_105718/g.268622  ORF Transcript_105718/g.268622 Transcript_105718/m.268622 type:complete len:325 (+) Transcript_105718:94-1068(+)|eukprot:CAMPEP_0183417452 /NCGR_PEP_ID=MMETSP0370-20130417/24439_1 /TAXON_ID=268820 /ORGANISM="Peridinium aciculiferum, Strain PAER-2" /LENGTH=324 /DNA_ID=CAMNT_0025601045 /DNA_START=1 /DNA_END=975 /DNA_ORIENTATION=+
MAPSISRMVSLALGSAGEGQQAKTWALQVGDTLRIGRGPKCDFILDLAGASTCHAELFLRPEEVLGVGADADADGGADAPVVDVGLFVRDTSKNGLGVRPPPLPSAGLDGDSSADVAGTPSWRGLPRGSVMRLDDSSRLLVPLKGRPSGAEELAHTLTVRVAPGPAAASSAGLSAGLPEAGTSAGIGGAGKAESVKAKTPARRIHIPSRRSTKLTPAQKAALLSGGARAKAKAGRRPTGDERAVEDEGVVAAARIEGSLRGERERRRTRDGDGEGRRRRRREERGPDQDGERHKKKKKKDKIDGYGYLEGRHQKDKKQRRREEL